MHKNIGKKDRLFRLFLGTILILTFFYFKSGILAIIGFFAIYEALISWCLIYQILGKNTCSLKNERLRNIDLINIFLTGLVILLTAVTLNIIGAYFGFANWYDLLSNYENTIQNISFDSLLFLFVLYPFSLGLSVFIFKKVSFGNNSKHD